MLGERGKVGPFGVLGGGSAALNIFSWETEAGRETPPLVSKVTDITLRAGKSVRLETPGGGGWGDPAARREEARARDLALGYVS